MYQNLQEFAIGKSFITIAQDEGSLNQSAKYISLSCADFIQKQTTVTRRTGSKWWWQRVFLGSDLEKY